MAEKRNTPEIRFEGFTDPWEQRKLGELIAGLSSGKSVNSKKGTVGPSDIGILKTSCVSYDMFDPTECKRVVDAEVRMVSCPVEAGTLIVSRMNTPDRVGACGFVPGNLPNLFLPDRLWKVKLAPGVDPYLIFVLLISDSNKARLKGMASGTSGSMHNIPKDSFKDLDVTLPRESKEQRAIGAFFSDLDNLITLHQRKYDKLCTVKRTMLDKMFPKPGETEPEIRFEGFTDPWEQRKFGELYRPVSEKNDLSFGRDRIISVANMYFNPAVYVTEDSYLATYNVMRLGDIAFEGNRSKRFAHGRFVENTIGDGIVSHVFKVFRPVGNNYDLAYWKHAINNEKLMKDALTRSTKASTMMHELVSSDFLEESTLVPTLDEQRAIGTAIDSIDNLITLHQRKLELLRNIKKSLLDRMFV